MMHLILLHVSNWGIPFIVEAVLIFGLSLFWKVGQKKKFGGGHWTLQIWNMGVKVFMFDG